MHHLFNMFLQKHLAKLLALPFRWSVDLSRGCRFLQFSFGLVSFMSVYICRYQTNLLWRYCVHKSILWNSLLQNPQNYFKSTYLKEDIWWHLRVPLMSLIRLQEGNWWYKVALMLLHSLSTWMQLQMWHTPLWISKPDIPTLSTAPTPAMCLWTVLWALANGIGCSRIYPAQVTLAWSSQG